MEFKEYTKVDPNEYTLMGELRGNVPKGTQVLVAPRRRDGAPESLDDIRTGPKEGIYVFVWYIKPNVDNQLEIERQFVYTLENADETLKQEKEWLSHYENT